MDCDTFDVEPPRRWGCGELRASERNRAISLSDKPTGTGTTGRELGPGDGEDRYWSGTISASEFPIIKGCCSAEILESWIVSEEFGSKGVTIKREPKSMEPFEDKIDVGLDLHLRRRFTKVTIQITAMMAARPARPPMVPPTIAPTSLSFASRAVPSLPWTVIVLLATLRERLQG